MARLAGELERAQSSRIQICSWAHKALGNGLTG